MWPDNVTVDDLIGFRVHAELIADVVSDPRLLPITLCIFGEWEREDEHHEDAAAPWSGWYMRLCCPNPDTSELLRQ